MGNLVRYNDGSPSGFVAAERAYVPSGPTFDDRQERRPGWRSSRHAALDTVTASPSAFTACPAGSNQVPSGVLLQEMSCGKATPLDARVFFTSLNVEFRARLNPSATSPFGNLVRRAPDAASERGWSTACVHGGPAILHYAQQRTEGQARDLKEPPYCPLTRSRVGSRGEIFRTRGTSVTPGSAASGINIVLLGGFVCASDPAFCIMDDTGRLRACQNVCGRGTVSHVRGPRFGI